MKEDILPDWLNKDYVVSVLKQKYSDAECLSFSTTAAVLGGNNYCSRMWRVEVIYKDSNDEKKSINFMVKASVPDGVRKEFLDEGKFVEKEFRFYNEIVPKIKKIAIKNDVIPQGFFSFVPETIVLEDLKEQGYVMCDRLKQLDLDHCRILMKTIARFHALSVAVAAEHPQLIANVGKEHIYVFGQRSALYEETLKNGLKGFSKTINNWKGFERFKYISEDKIDLFLDKYSEISSPRKDFNVLNHGDLWTNNILFKHNEDGQVIDAKLVDFQLCKYASPGVDLNFFIWSSIEEDVRENRIEELLTIYLDTLNANLEEFGCEERLSKKQLEEELEFTRVVGFFILFIMLPVILSDPEDSMHENYDDFGKDETYTMKTYEGKYYKLAALKSLIKLEKTIQDVFCNS